MPNHNAAPITPTWYHGYHERRPASLSHFSYRATTGVAPPQWTDALGLIGRYKPYPLMVMASRVKDAKGKTYPNTVFFTGGKYGAADTDGDSAFADLVATDCPTIPQLAHAVGACTKNQLLFNRDHCDKLPASQLAWVVLHEALHWLRADPALYMELAANNPNINQAVLAEAIEHRVNLDIANALKHHAPAQAIKAITPPPQCDKYMDKTYTDPRVWSVEAIYQYLMSKQQDPQDPQDQQPDPELAMDSLAGEHQNASTNKSDDNDSGDDAGTRATGEADNEGQTHTEAASNQTNADQRELRRDRLEQIDQLSKTAGIDSPVESELAELNRARHVGPDPVSIIRKWATAPARNQFSYNQIEPMLRGRARLPTREGKQQGNILIALDVSGSVLGNVKQYELIQRAIVHVARNCRHVDLITFDTRVIAYTPDADKLAKRNQLEVNETWGGTRLDAPLKWLRGEHESGGAPATKRRGKYKAVLCFTDGYGPIDLQEPKPKTPWGWVLCGGHATKQHIPDTWLDARTMPTMVLPDTECAD